jgi:hypothetical protein
MAAFCVCPFCRFQRPEEWHDGGKGGLGMCLRVQGDQRDRSRPPGIAADTEKQGDRPVATV